MEDSAMLLFARMNMAAKVTEALPKELERLLSARVNSVAEVTAVLQKELEIFFV